MIETPHEQRDIYEGYAGNELLEPTPQVIILDGAPCSGKTSILEAIEAEAREHCVIIPEIASQVDAELREHGTSLGEIASKQDRTEFVAVEKQILAGYLAAIDTAREQLAGTNGIVLVDRGPRGVRAYVSPAEWDQITSELGINNEAILTGYADRVLFLQSLAVTDPDKYNLLRRQNPARHESVEGAAELHHRTLDEWSAHPRLEVIQATELDDIQQEVAYWMEQNSNASTLPIARFVTEAWMQEASAR